MRLSAKLFIGGAVFFLILCISAYLALGWLFGVRTLTVIEKTSPDGQHSAKLITREAGLDVNLTLKVDSRMVYTSPDFAAPARADFQEHLAWDGTNQIVLLEVAGKRLFGFHASERRPLSSSELSRIQLASFDELGFTVDLEETHVSPQN